MSKFARLRLEVLEPRLLLDGALGAQGVYPLNVPPAGETHVEALAVAAAPAAYRIVAPATGRLTIRAVGNDPTVDPALSVYDAGGSLLAYNDNAYSTPSLVRVRVDAGQTLTVWAQSPRAGRYTLTAISEPVDDGGDTIGDARPLALDGRQSARLLRQIDYGGDMDVLAVTAAATGQMYVTMTTAGGLTQGGSLAVLNGSGDPVIWSPSPASPAKLIFDVTGGVTYYIRAAGSGPQTGRYCILVTSGPPAGAADKGAVPPSPKALAQAELVDGRPQLFVYGTEGADAITMSQSQGQIDLQFGSQVQVIAGTFTLITLEAYAGDDVITLEHSLSIPVHIALADGIDTIYAASTGADWIDGGPGDDLLVSVGGGADRITGSGGSDSFWSDSSDTIADSSSAERASGAVHSISQFAQPFTQTATSPQFMPLEAAGQNLADPAASGYANFADRPLFANDPAYSDVRQGKVTDCYFLSSLAGYARINPDAIRQMIAPLGDGTYAVRFYRDGHETYYRVDADLPVTGGARLGAGGALWVALLEKAYAFFRKGLNSYSSLNSGWMTDVYRGLTNSRATNRVLSGDTSQAVYANLWEDLAAGYNVAAGSKSSAGGPIVASHGYTVMSVDTISGQLYVTLYNPWGRDGRSYDSNPADGLLRLTITKFIAEFDYVAVGYA